MAVFSLFSAPPLEALAPSSRNAPQIILNEEDREIFSLLKARIPLHERTDDGGIKKIGEVFRFCEGPSGETPEFEEGIKRIDAQYSRDYLRVFPARIEGKPAVGVNLLNEDGSIGHFLIKRRPAPAKKIRLPRNLEADQKESATVVLECGEWDLALAPNGLDKSFLDTLKGAQDVKEALPVPMKRLESSREQIREFLETVPLDVESLLLDPLNDTTFEAFLRKYPEATVVFEEAFPEEFKNRKNFIPRILDPKDKKIYIVTIINRVLQEIFLRRFGRPTDGILDFSQLQAADTRQGSGTTGPDKVNYCLTQFKLALEKAKIDSQRPLEEVRFKKPPLQSFAEWLPQHRERPLVLEPTGGNDTETFAVSDGVLIFDVDKTLLNKGENLSQAHTEIYYTLIQLLELGIPMRIISGNAAREQFSRVLAPFEAYFAKRKNSPLNRLELFTSTGSVRICFDAKSRRFVRDKTYNIKPLLGMEEPGSASSDREDIEALAGQAESDLRPLTEKLLAQNGFDADEKGLTLLQGPRNFCRVENNFGEKAPENVPSVYFEMRDGQSLTLKGEGLKAAALSKAGMDWMEREYPGFVLNRSQKVSYREAVILWLRYLASRGSTAQRRAYGRFDYTPGGSTSIDVTFLGQNKATAAYYIFRQNPSWKREAAVYFGDEFTEKGGMKGNDLSMNDPALKGIRLVHVGDEELKKPLYRVIARKMDSKYDLSYSRELMEEPDMYFILDSLDGSEEVQRLILNPEAKRSYTVALYYRHYPILVETFFAHEPSNKLLISDLTTPSRPLAAKPAAAFLPYSKQDRREEQSFVAHLRQWLEKQNVQSVEETVPGSSMVRRLVDPHDPLWLVRQGKAPKSKLGIMAHVYLRGGESVVLLPAPRPLFPLDLRVLGSESQRYGTVYSFFSPGDGAETTLSLMRFLNASAGEQNPIEWMKEPTVLDAAI